MSKYYKAEDLQKALIGFIRRTGIVELPYDYATDVLDSLPTIEVEEDCISKAYLEQEIENHLLSTENLRTEKDEWWNKAFDVMVEIIEDAPSVVPTIEVMEYPQVEGITPTLVTPEVSEDCISREYLEEFQKGREMFSKTGNFDDLLWLIKHAPSVVPTCQKNRQVEREEGEWTVEKLDSYYGKKIRLTCSECGDVFDVTEGAYPYERYCRYCGAKMK